MSSQVRAFSVFKLTNEERKHTPQWGVGEDAGARYVTPDTELEKVAKNILTDGTENKQKKAGQRKPAL